jgi:cytochrome c553
MQHRFIAMLFWAISAGATGGTVSAQDAPAPATEAATPATPAPDQAKRPPRPAYLDLRRTRAITGNAAAGKEKAQVCTACHGANGVSPAPIFPNLVGQSTEYLYWSLVEYKRARGPASAMTSMVASLSDQDMRDLAAHFSAVTAEVGSSPPAASQGEPPQDATLLEAGQRIFNDGNAGRGVPPCQGCHGLEGSGHPLAKQGGSARAQAYYRTYPLLKGQKADYVVARLTQYRERQLHDSSNDFIMQSVANQLDDDSIRSVAAWLASRR